jgi:hypothetical protein
MPNDFERIRQETEDNQKATLWEDGLRNGKSVDEFLWKGDSNAKPIQRAGLIVFAITFWFLGVLITAISWSKGSDDEGPWGVFFGSLIGLAFVALSIRLFFNAFCRKKQHTDEPDCGE